MNKLMGKFYYETAWKQVVLQDDLIDIKHHFYFLMVVDCLLD